MKRAKKALLIGGGVSLVAAMALGSVFAFGGLHKAHAATNASVGAITLVGDTVISTGVGSTVTGGQDDQVRPETDRSPQVPSASANGNLPAPPTTNPNPAGLGVTTNNSGEQGFNGLSHYDQRTAGTGAYANTQFSLEPPDQGLCAGGGFVVEAVNNAIAVYTQQGHLHSGPMALSQFYGMIPEINRSTGFRGQFISDPKCLFDTESQRWFVTELMMDTGTNGTGRTYQLIAVSQSANPSGSFTVFKFDTTDDGQNGTPSHASCPCLGDQPLIGADHNGFYITTNEFGESTGFNGAQVYAISKWSLAAAAAHSGSIPPVVHIDASQQLVPFGGLSYSIQPAVSNPGQQGNVEYFLSALQFGNPGYEVLDNRIAVWALTNTASLASSSPSVTLTSKVISSETYGQPNNVSQKVGAPGSTPLGTALGDSQEQLQTNDDRMNQVVFANGYLWGAVNTIIADGSRSGIAYFKVHPSVSQGSVDGSVVSQGYVAVDGNSVLFPSVAVNSQNQGVIAFSLVGKDYFPSAAYVQLNGDGVVGGVHVSGAGVGPDDGFTGYPQYSGGTAARWGDYSAAVVSEDGTIWTANEYIPGGPRTLLANWGTFVAHLGTSN